MSIRRSVKYESISKNEIHQQPLPKVYINSEHLREMPGNGFLTPPKPFSTEPWLVRGYDAVLKKDVQRPMTAIDPAEVDPEIKDISKSDGNYHVMLSLNANFLNRPSSALPASAITSDRLERNYANSTSFQTDVLDYNQVPYNRPASVANHLLTGYNSNTLTNQDLISYNSNTLTNQDLISYNANNLIKSDLLKNSQMHNHTYAGTFPITSPQRNANSKAVVNIDATKNVTIRSSNVPDDDFIIKSIKSTDKSAILNNKIVDDDVKLDLRLFAKTKVVDTTPIVEREIIKVEPTRKQAATKKSRKIARPLNDEVNDFHKRTNRSLQREISPESTVVKKAMVNVMIEANDRQSIQKSCNTDPEVTSTGVQTLSVSNSAVQTDFVPEPVIINEPVIRYGSRKVENDYEDYAPQPKLTQQTSRQINISQAYDAPDYEDENQYMMSSGFVRRLMEGAPQGSLQQKMDVKKEEDEIVGPLPKEEIERMYTNSMINVDSVSEKVDLTLSEGIAQLVVKITYERIVPIENSPDTFKKSAVVVTKIIDVNLTVTDERRKIYDHIIESHNNGRLDNKYTFDLYKAFMALAEADEGLGMNQEHFSIEKKVDEEKLWNVNSNSLEINEQRNLNILENKLSDFSNQPTMTYRPSNAFSETRKSFHQWENNENVFPEPYENISSEWKTSMPRGGQETDSFEYFNTRSAIGSTTAYNKMKAEDFYKERAGTWKSIFSNWTDEAAKESQRLQGHSGQNKLSQRMNVHEYLRPGGNRTHNLMTDSKYKLISMRSKVIGQEENLKSSVDSLSNAILNNTGIQPGGHRQRMNSYLDVTNDKSMRDSSNRTPIPNTNYMTLIQ